MSLTKMFGVLCLMCVLASTASAQDIPHLREQGNTKQLIVHGQPFLMLAGELGNSTASDLNYLQQFWPLFDTLNLNTVLAPVSWELIEPKEGTFDFSSVDGLLKQARASNQRLVLLWFGAWKNSMSSYAPSWVKRDQARFPRSQLPSGQGMEILSPFSTANRDADARAFAALMTHLKQVDDRQHTVIMVQVENEIGMIPEARDYSDSANRAFKGPVPAELLTYINAKRTSLTPFLSARLQSNGNRSSGSWEEIFGKGIATEEIFMAWHFATYVEEVTRAGKRVYPLPMFVNAALIRPGRQPGEYPSAGPLPHLFDIWKAGAPSIDFFAPDIYFPNFVEWARAYVKPDNPLFIPEIGRAPEAIPSNAFYAIGELDAMGFSPFAIEDYKATDALGDAYDALDRISHVVLEHQGKGTMVGVRPIVSFEGVVDDTPQTMRLGDFTITVTFKQPNHAQQTLEGKDPLKVEAHGGLIIQLGPEEYLIAGKGMIVTFATEDALVGFDSIYEGTFREGRWIPGRLLNGDQSHQGRHVRIPEEKFDIQRVKLYRYR